ncbi:MAG: cob(I)yrinic acid a,c-diamide adenosyltransferase [Paludibacteraceae bacterium]|nr:cob(I)yrinic acid a,c-diamide adenosyltransferase [Paludibacteraceae bacterium]
MKVYTKTGDKGTTCLIGGTRVSKSDARLEAYGTADELNSFVGWLRAMPLDEQIQAELEFIQNKLFNLGGYLAIDQEKFEPTPSTSISSEHIVYLEQAIDRMEAELPELHSFILPGGSESVSRCHICRTVCRRLERRMVELFSGYEQSSSFDANALQFVNRLSDYLFILSKKVAKNEKIDLFSWKS